MNSKQRRKWRRLDIRILGMLEELESIPFIGTECTKWRKLHNKIVKIILRS